ncbi:enoyl-CoA hydratase/isomerase family protein [Bacillus sp. 1P06AnD]|uniref:enoyl-CoA hydratase/isomerase family protein n=1 Tax=Bacillus sp. 1P06AnD TaxID=3132208 RepID=UPI0039A141CA
MSQDVAFSVNSNGVATILLNRPKALNSLSFNMVHLINEKLKEWEFDHSVFIVILKGAGEKGFCAGGDIKELYKARTSELALKNAELFFQEEYETDIAIHQFSKPIIACLDGIVMGGGVGLTYGASHRIVTERTKWSMPEMNIGFFPDVGGAYFLNKAPGYIGRYLALTASVIQADDVLYINGADFYMDKVTLENFIKQIEETVWNRDKVDNKLLDHLVNSHQTTPPQKSKLSQIQSDIDENFRFNTMEKIIQSLDQKDSTFNRSIKNLLLSKSPFSLKITLKQLIDGKQKTMQECFSTDLLLAKNFLKHNDFYEGVRSILIDRDHSPSYEFQKISDVTDEVVTNFFRSL